MRHKQAKIRGIKVDAGIASLIEAIWGAGINTYGSCQKHKSGSAWIGFATEADMWRFVEITSHLQDDNWHMSKLSRQIGFPVDCFGDIMEAALANPSDIIVCPKYNTGWEPE